MWKTCIHWDILLRFYISFAWLLVPNQQFQCEWRWLCMRCGVDILAAIHSWIPVITQVVIVIIIRSPPPSERKRRKMGFGGEGKKDALMSPLRLVYVNKSIHAGGRGMCERNCMLLSTCGTRYTNDRWTIAQHKAITFLLKPFLCTE